MKFSFTAVSSNQKTGPIPTTMSDRETCPPSCPLYKNCYAQYGPTKMWWDKVSLSFNDLLDKVSRLRFGTLFRHNVAGDLPGQGELIDSSMMRRLIKAAKGKKGFTYTHKNPIVNKEIIHFSNLNGFTVNLSADSLSEADKFKALNIAPVVVAIPSDQMTNLKTPAGNRVVVCPAVTRDNVTCATCGLCQRVNRDIIIGFPAHGTAKKKVNEIIGQLQ